MSWLGRHSSEQVFCVSVAVNSTKMNMAFNALDVGLHLSMWQV